MSGDIERETERQLEAIEDLVGKMETPEEFAEFLEQLFEKAKGFLRKLGNSSGGCILRFCLATKAQILTKRNPQNPFTKRLNEILTNNGFDLESIRSVSVWRSGSTE